MSACKYHPLVLANYYCEQCEAQYCDTCSDETPQAIDHKRPRLCIRCDNELTELDHTTDVEPFWRRLSSVYLYPFTIYGVILLSLIAFLSSIAPSSIALQIISAIPLINYCLICLNSSANGIMTPPDVDNLLSVNLATFYRLFALIFLIAVIIHFSEGILGADFAILVGLFFSITLPASIISIVIDKKLVNAINPLKLMSIVTAAGTSYFFLCLFLFIMLSSLGLANQFFLSNNPSFINYFATALVSSYYCVVIFHLMGYVVYQNHKKLGFPVKTYARKGLIRPEKKRITDNIETLTKAGDYMKAATLSEKRINEGSALWEWERCFKLMLISSKVSKLTTLVDNYMVILSDQKQFDLMANCYLKTRQRTVDYQPKNIKLILEISAALIAIGQYKNTVLLLKQLKLNSLQPQQVRQVYKLLSKAFNNLDGYQTQASEFAIKAAKIKI